MSEKLLSEFIFDYSIINEIEQCDSEPIKKQSFWK